VKIEMDKNRKKIIEENEVSEVYTFSLGQMPQKVLIEGKSKELPVVISLHGGRELPCPFLWDAGVYFRRLQIVLLWSTGINWAVALTIIN